MKFERTRIQRKRSDTAQSAAPADTAALLQSGTAGGGQALDDSMRARVEPGFGHDFGNVRVHTDERAAASAEAMGAHAFTAGNDIVFGSGEYSPSSPGGQELIAHELAHVVQQQSAPAAPQMSPLVSRSGDAAEVEARDAASRVLAGEQVQLRESPPASTIHRDETTLTSEPEDAVEDTPYLVGTSYGTFLVYPDILSLPPAEYGATEWAVTQSVFDRIAVAMESIEGAAAGIVVEGEDFFKSAVMMDLAWLMTQDIGNELIEEIVGSGRQLTIEEVTGGNECSYDPNDDSFERPDGSPGPGADVTIGYNISEWNPYGGDEPWMTRPPAIGLAHEMVHAWTGVYGTRALGQTDGVNRRELQATGLGEFSEAIFHENRFRAAFGLELRPEY